MPKLFSALLALSLSMISSARADCEPFQQATVLGMNVHGLILSLEPYVYPTNPTALGIADNLERRGQALAEAPEALRRVYREQGAQGIASAMFDGVAHLVTSTGQAVGEVTYEAMHFQGDESRRRIADQGTDILLNTADLVTLGAGVKTAFTGVANGTRAMGSELAATARALTPPPALAGGGVLAPVIATEEGLVLVNTARGVGPGAVVVAMSGVSPPDRPTASRAPARASGAPARPSVQPNGFGGYRAGWPGDPRAIAMFEFQGETLRVTDLFRGAQPKGSGARMLADAVHEVRPGAQPTRLRLDGIINRPTVDALAAGSAPLDTVIGKTFQTFVREMGGEIVEVTQGVYREKPWIEIQVRYPPR